MKLSTFGHFICSGALKRKKRPQFFLNFFSSVVGHEFFFWLFDSFKYFILLLKWYATIALDDPYKIILKLVYPVSYWSKLEFSKRLSVVCLVKKLFTPNNNKWRSFYHNITLFSLTFFYVQGESVFSTLCTIIHCALWWFFLF